jgi:hypothetical protein
MPEETPQITHVEAVESPPNPRELAGMIKASAWHPDGTRVIAYGRNEAEARQRALEPRERCPTCGR